MTASLNAKSFLIVGAGFSGAVLARRLAEAGAACHLIDERPHIGGNCHTERDHESEVMVHVYGPHIFHTANERVWEYVQKFGKFQPYINRVKAFVKGTCYSLPVNLKTINRFFNKNFTSAEAEAFITESAVNYPHAPVNFEEQALSMIGKALYEGFFKGYTEKQWGLRPTQLPASIFRRLPLRFNEDDNYFSHPYQGIPEEGYTAIIEKMLDHPRISLQLNTKAEAMDYQNFSHVFYTGPLDRYFDHSEGYLPYRTLDFERHLVEGTYQETAVVNYCDKEIPYTRIAEHKHFAPWEADRFTKSVYFKETSRAAEPQDTPFYPVRLSEGNEMLKRYIAKARQEKNISFLGRLGTFRYLDMDVTIHEALKAADWIEAHEGEELPVFFHEMED